MKIIVTLQELHAYKNFDELAQDVLELTKEIFPDKLVYLTSFEDREQRILKLSSTETNILLKEGMAINLEHTVCHLIDFNLGRVLIYEGTSNSDCMARIQSMLKEVNIQSYVGIPISIFKGEKFGTLCIVDEFPCEFRKSSIESVQRIARLFSYYLNLEYLAFRDALTDLYNRRYLTNYFEANGKDGGSLFFLDLDGFKTINDVYGHDAGDAVLQQVARKLKLFIMSVEQSIAVRHGGDEFILYFPNRMKKNELTEFANKLLRELNDWPHYPNLSVSIGIKIHEAGQQDLKLILNEADQALYDAKSAGKNTYKFFRNDSSKIGTISI